MNHLTPAEAFRRRLRAMSHPQLEEALLVLRKHDEDAVDRALAFAAMPFGVPDSGRLAGLRDVVATLAIPRADGIAASAMSVDCPDCGAAAGDRCWSDFGCIARYNAAQVAS